MEEENLPQQVPPSNIKTYQIYEKPRVSHKSSKLTSNYNRDRHLCQSIHPKHKLTGQVKSIRHNYLFLGILAANFYIM